MHRGAVNGETQKVLQFVSTEPGTLPERFERFCFPGSECLSVYSVGSGALPCQAPQAERAVHARSVPPQDDRARTDIQLPCCFPYLTFVSPEQTDNLGR